MSEVAEIRISSQEIRDAAETDFLDGLLSEYTGEEREQVRLGLSSWLDYKLQGTGLELTDETKTAFINLMALIMKKVSKMLNEAEG